MSSVPRRRFDRFTVALSLLFFVPLPACGSVEPTAAGDRSDEVPGPSTPHSGTAETVQCTPSIALGDPVAAPLPSFACPYGWDARPRNSALPISGRFKTAREMVDALCTESADSTTTSNAEPMGIAVGVDFDANDVVAIPYSGEIGLHRRAGELWIRLTESCERSYRTALFVVPKDVEPREQTCSMPCQ